MNARYYSGVLLALCLGMPPETQAYETRQSRTGSVIRWERAELPIHYYIDSNPAMPKGAVIQAFQKWENVGPTRLSFAYRGLIEKPAVVKDGRNCIIWVEEGWRHGPQTTAHATTWYYLEDGRIVECDIELNAQDYEWSATPSEGALDIQNVLTHEIGHFLGLDDVFSGLDSTMFSFILRGETKKRSLDVDDVRGSSFLYPLSAAFEEIEASSLDPERAGLDPILSPRSTPEGTNIILLSSCDWESDGTAGEIAAVAYEAESGFTFYVYGLPDSNKGEKEISTLAKDEWMIASGSNARCMAVVDANRDGFRDEIAILKDAAEGGSFLNVYRFSSTADAPSLICSVFLGEADSTTHIAAMNGNEICMLRKVNGRDYNLSLYRLETSEEALSLIQDYGKLPIDADEEVLSLFPLEEEPGKATSMGILMVDSDKRARIECIEPTPDGEVASFLSVQLPGISPVLATSIDSNGDGLISEIVLITE